MNNILITGAASGIGAATARLFHSRGWQVGLLDINHSALAALASELGGVWHAELDVADPGAVQDALRDFTAQHQGQLRLLFNCAGILRFGLFEQVEFAEHARILQVNVLGLMQITHAAFAYLKDTPDAQVINAGSASGFYGTAHLASYSTSKFAVRGFTEALNIEWEPYGIQVGDIMPAFVSTPMISSQGFQPPVLHRLGVDLAAEDIALATWAQAHAPRVHRPVGGAFSLLYWLGQITPDCLIRRLLRWFSRPL